MSAVDGVLNFWTIRPEVKEREFGNMAQHYKQIIVNMAVEDDLKEVELQILKEKIEECININVDPDKVKEVRVRVN